MPTSASSDSFTVDKLTIREAHLLQLALDDLLPCLTVEAHYQFKTTCSILFSPDQPDLLRVNVQVRASARPAATAKTGAKASAKLLIAAIFHYADLPALQQQELPVALGWTAVSIAYSTVRGMMKAHLAGTSFAGAVLPIVNPQLLWQPPVSPGQSETQS